MFCFHLFLVCVVAISFCRTARGDVIDDEYLIMLDDGTTQAEEDAIVATLENDHGIMLIKAHKISTQRILYVTGSAEDIENAKSIPKVKLIEQNAEVHSTDCCGKKSSPGTWGLDRIDQNDELVSKLPFDILATYTVGPYRGAGVMAYVVDTGIDVSHPDFGGRAHWGYTTFGMDGDADLNGHGTHVAGIIGSESYGVAKESTLMAVKVLHKYGWGSYAGVIDGLVWVFFHHVSRWIGPNSPKSVVNLSFQGRKMTCVNVITDLLTYGGITVVASAGDNNGDACDQSPASASRAITVGHTNIWDKTVLGSNWGTCVDLYGPGLHIKSTWPGNSVNTLSGTSMASPHVAGVVALKLSKEYKTAPQMKAWITSKASLNKVFFFDGNHATSPNRLLFFECTLAD